MKIITYNKLRTAIIVFEMKETLSRILNLNLWCSNKRKTTVDFNRIKKKGKVNNIGIHYHAYWKIFDTDTNPIHTPSFKLKAPNHMFLTSVKVCVNETKFTRNLN